MQDLFSAENQVITIVIIGVVLLLLMSFALVLFFFFSRKKIIEKELEKQRLEVAHQKELLQAIIITQEDERKRIAQDLHDDISSKLNVIHLHANLLLDGKLTANEYTIINKQIIEATHKTLGSARKIAHNLLPPILDKFGLKAAIEELTDSFNTSKKITISCDINYPNNHLSSEKELHVFRILQELINNSIKHGNATKSSILLRLQNRKLLLKYIDNGVGFNPEIKQYKKGIGLKNIESRIALLQGNIIIKSALKKGINVTASI